jgi:6-pyruvoyltetrahydropterin/6-carboxytetrahydropterin synthase
MSASSPSVDITVAFMFSAAHRLPRYDGPCKNLHGHNYKLVVTVGGGVDGYSGMTVDFYEVQRLVQRHVLEKIDHTDLNELLENPTAEHLVLWMWGKLIEPLPGLRELKLFETDEYSVTLRA